MAIRHVVVPALIPGATEFLPISSPAHLIPAVQPSRWPDRGWVFDVAVYPGTLLTAGLFSGLTRDVAARFSFLLSIPVTVAAGSLKILQLVSTGVSVDWRIIFNGIAIFAVGAMACIHYFPVFINRIGVMPFVIYRLWPGGVLPGVLRS